MIFSFYWWFNFTSKSINILLAISSCRLKHVLVLVFLSDRWSCAGILIPIGQYNCAQTAFPINQGVIVGGNGCHWRPCTDCKEKWILITITSGVKNTNTSHSAPSLCKIIHLITVNVCKYVCKCRFMRGLWVGLIILLWGVIVNQSRHVLQRVIRFTTYSLPVSFVMPFAVWPSLV